MTGFNEAAPSRMRKSLGHNPNILAGLQRDLRAVPKKRRLDAAFAGLAARKHQKTGKSVPRAVTGISAAPRRSRHVPLPYPVCSSPILRRTNRDSPSPTAILCSCSSSRREIRTGIFIPRASSGSFFGLPVAGFVFFWGFFAMFSSCFCAFFRILQKNQEKSARFVNDIRNNADRIIT
jgi:hypothetical protein